MQRAFISLLPLATLSCLIPFTAQAQVTPDGTTSTTVNQDGNNFTIDQGNRVGDNLFHSFNEFSVPTLGSAVFNNAGDIANIFSRVTGSNISNIDGLIGANGAANLFLINPNGIIFGQNASLNLGGSFFASTADSLLFDGNQEFSAVNPQATPLLEVNIPIGARFRDNPGDIINQSAADDVGLSVPEGESIFLVGGNVSIENGGIIFAPGGRIELGGLSEAGTLGISDDGTLSFPDALARGDVSLTNGAIVSVRFNDGGDISVNAKDLELTNGSQIVTGIDEGLGSVDSQAGDILINASESTIIDTNSIILNVVSNNSMGNAGTIDFTTTNLSLTNGGVIDTSTFGNGNGGNIVVNASESVIIDTNSTIFNVVEINAEGNAGQIDINTKNLSFINGGVINASTLGQGNSGNIFINTIESVNINESSTTGETTGIFTNVQPNAEGNGGNINLKTASLNINNIRGTSLISSSTFSTGNAGNINIDSDNIEISNSLGSRSGILADVRENAEGNSGQIIINTTNLNINGFNSIISTGNFGEGDSGNLNISAANSININGSPDATGLFSGIFDSDSITGSSGTINIEANTINLNGGGININNRGVGNGGSIEIATNNLNLINGGQIAANTSGQGNAGDITINSNESVLIDGIVPISLLNSDTGILSSVESEKATGEGGALTINTTNLSLTDGGLITTDSLGKGDAGEIQINTANLSLTNGSQIGAGITGEGNGGSIKINATESISLDGINNNIPTGIFNRVQFGAREGNAGEIEINTANLYLTNGSQIAAGVTGEGNGGSIKINASESVLIDGSTDNNNVATGIFNSIDEEGIGNAGKLEITTTNLSLINSGQISVSSFGEGNGGAIDINASESILIDGTNNNSDIDTGIFSAIDVATIGDAGELKITTTDFFIIGGGAIAVSSFGAGNAGNISIEADALTLNRGNIISGNMPSQLAENEILRVGGNINLKITDNIIFQNNSLISSEAGSNANGGNIIANAEFIIAFPNQNNDITTNASQGNGGNIDITTQAIFGLEERRSTPPNTTNDIDASSEFGLQGSFSLNTPDVDPTSGLIELPASVGDASDQISQNPCEKGVGSEFIITGKGGFPANPHETLNSDEVRVGLVEPLPQTLSYEERGEKRADEATGRQGEEDNHTSTASEQLVPAMGWVFNDKGQVTLTAYDPRGNGQQRFQTTKTSCSADPKEN